MRKNFYLIIAVIVALVGLLIYVINRKINVEYLLGSIFFMDVYLKDCYSQSREDIFKDGSVNRFDERSELIFYKSRAKVNVIVQCMCSGMFLIATILRFIGISFYGRDLLMIFSFIIYIIISGLNVYFNKKIDMEQ